MWKSVVKSVAVLGVGVLLGIGCTGTGAEAEGSEELAAGDLCEQVATHVSGCIGESVPADPSCNAQEAQMLLDMSCSDLQRRTREGKGDYREHGLMCHPLFFWTECNRGINISVTVSYEEDENWLDWSDGISTEDSCFTFQIKDAAGNVVVKETTRGSNHLMTEDLEDGDYTIELLNRDGSVVELMDTPGTLTGNDYSNELDGKFTVTNGRSDSYELFLPVYNTNAENFHQCGSLNANVQLFCDGEVYKDHEAKWDWYATIRPVSEDTWVRAEDEYEEPPYLLSSTYGSYIDEQYDKNMDLDVYRKSMTIYQLSPGTFEIDFYYIIHENGWSYNNTSFADEKFKEFIFDSGYMSGYKETRTVELKPEDFATSFGRALVDLDISYPSACPR